MSTKYLIGLDIGSMSIRAVETRHGKEGPVISAFGLVPLPPDAVRGGTVQDPVAVARALKQLRSRTKFHTRDTVLGVTNPQVVVREMSVADMPDRELHQSLPFQVRDMLPLPVEKSVLDFYRLERQENPDKSGKSNTGENTVRGLLIASPKEAVVTAVRAVERAGFHVKRVDLASLALLRSVSRLDGRVEALVDIGAEATSVVIHLDGEPLIVRTIPRGGAEITTLVAERLRIPVEQAEALKRQVGLRPAVGTPDGQVVADAFREALHPLISEIRGSFAYLTAGGRQARIDRLAVSGGTALMPGLAAVLEDQLDLAVVVADPMVRLRPVRRGRHDGLVQLQSSVAVSIGLTLGAA